MPRPRLLLIILLFVSTALAQNKDSVITDGVRATPPVSWRVKQYRTAGHGVLEYLAGKWEITATLWLAGPDRPPVAGKGYGEWNTILENRYLQIEDSVIVAGRALKVMGYMSWEEAARQLQLEIYGNFGTGLLAATGAADDSLRNFSFSGSAPQPVRLTLHWINGNHCQLDVFSQTRDGREYKLIAADYLRSYGPPEMAEPVRK